MSSARRVSRVAEKQKCSRPSVTRPFLSWKVMQQSTSRFLRARVPVYRRKNASSWQGDRLTSTNASPVSALARFVLRAQSGTHPESRHTLALMRSDIAVPSRPLVCRRLMPDAEMVALAFAMLAPQLGQNSTSNEIGLWQIAHLIIEGSADPQRTLAPQCGQK